MATRARLIAPKLALLALAWAAGVAIERWPRAGELDWSLGYVSFGVVSFISVQWRRLLALDVAAAGAWIGVILVSAAFRWLDSAAARTTRLAIGLVNLHAAHFEALFSWFLLILTTGLPAWLRLPGALAVLLFGPRLLDWRGQVRQIAASRDAEWRWPWSWFVTCMGASALGLAFLLVSGYPRSRILILILIITIGGGLRLVAAVLHHWLIDPLPRRRSQNRQVLRIHRVARALVWASALLFGGAMIYRELSALFASHAQNLRDRVERAQIPGPDGAPGGGASPAGGDVVSLFIIADQHFHELRGIRTGGDLQIVDSVVPQAVRPVELDLLSGVPLLQFADLYQSLRVSRPGMKWADLGDYNDNGCRTEIERLPRYWARFGESPVALLSGNHDGRFVGNFSWHPAWRAVCYGAPILKPEVDRVLRDAGGGGYIFFEDDDLGVQKSSALARVAPLGHDIDGVFFDSSDDTGPSLGLNGLEGAISDQQADRLIAAIGNGSSKLVFFTHHPVDALSDHGRRNFERAADHAGARLVAVISAHTHLAGVRDDALAGRHVPELVVGSTIDPPQEASLLEISPHTGEVRLRTFQTAARHNAAPECVTRLRALPLCAPLFDDTPPPRAEAPDQLRAIQEARARVLLGCLGISDSPHPFSDPQLYQRIDEFLVRRVDDTTHQIIDREALACLSWAGSILQGHKSEGWTFARALEHGFEDGAAPGEMDVTVKAGAEKIYRSGER